MSVEALWTVEYEDGGSWHNGGVVVCQAGRAFGGDGQFYYIGRYTNEGVKFDAKISAAHYAGSAKSAFGVPMKQMTIDIAATTRANLIEGFMRSSAAPGVHVPVRLTKRAELP